MMGPACALFEVRNFVNDFMNLGLNHLQLG